MVRAENKFEFDRSNITEWHARGFTGKGIKFASLEDNSDHNKNVLAVIEQVAPDAIEYAKYDMSKLSATSTGDHLNDTAPGFVAFIDGCIANGVDVITCSYNYEHNIARETALLKAIDAGIIVFWAIGNDGGTVKPQMIVGMMEEIVQVGAVLEVKGGKIEHANYSNHSKLLNMVGFTNIVTKTGSIFTGTSCATPLSCGICILILQLLKENRLNKKLWKEVIRYEDLGAIGWDEVYGDGLIGLMDIDEAINTYKFTIKLTIDSTKAYVNGVETILDVAPKVENERTLVPLRFLAESLGCNVAYNSETKEITITK
jgi:hypothetical protein